MKKAETARLPRTRERSQNLRRDREIFEDPVLAADRAADRIVLGMKKDREDSKKPKVVEARA